MAKPAAVQRANVKLNQARKAAAAADAAIGEKPIKAKKAAPLPAPPKVEAPRRGRGMSTSGTVASVTRELIREGKLSDEAILAKVRETFPDKSIASNVVKHYRAHM